MLVRFHRSLRTTTLPEVGRVHQKEEEVFHSADIKVRDNYQLRVNWVQVALIVEMTKKGAGECSVGGSKGGGGRYISDGSCLDLSLPTKKAPSLAYPCCQSTPFPLMLHLATRASISRHIIAASTLASKVFYCYLLVRALCIVQDG